MSMQNIVPVSALNEISGSGLLIANSLIRAAKNVKIYRSQCEHLSNQCLDLASALHDHSSGLEGTGAQQVVDVVERVLTRILNRMRTLGELGKIKSFAKQAEIKLELDKSYQELRACSMRFNLALHLEASTRSRELEEIRKRDHDEIVEIMTRALHEQSLLKMELATSTPEVAHNIVEVIEQGLREADVGETQERQLQEDFGELQRWVEGLPPMVDLSGKVFRTSDHAIASGGSQDIYTGEWTGTEVALAYPRNQSRAAQERFRRQVEIWRTLRHPNILQLLGIAYIGDSVYSVSPYMEFGHVKEYLKDHPGVNRVLLLGEIASATEYLHTNGIIHGDIQGSNVLISGDGHACLGDFGHARIEQVPVTEGITYGALRWIAPELVAESDYVPTTRATDVWSFGMLSIEIFTDNVPFSNILNEAFIPLAIRDGPLPTRPDKSITVRGLSDAMWNLMNQCWQRNPESRPSMSEIREAIQNMHAPRSFVRSGRSLSSTTSPKFQHGNSFSSATGVPSGSHPSALSLSRPPRTADSIPPTDPLPLPNPLPPIEVVPEPNLRGLPASFPTRKSPILNIPLSSSPPQGLTSARSLPGPGKPLLSPVRPSPLSSSFQLPLPSTAPEFQSSIPPPTDHLDWSLKRPKDLPESATASNPQFPLLLQPIHTNPGSSSQPDSVYEYEIRRSESTSTGSGSIRSYGPDRGTSVSSVGGGLLDAAVQDPESLLRRNAEGIVEAGTLEGLVDRLIKDTHDRAKDNEFRRVFFATYSIFTTREDLFKIFKRRFEEMGDVRASIHSAAIPYSILQVMRIWLGIEGEYMGSELLSAIKEFSRSIEGSDKMREAAGEIVSLASEKMNVAVVSPTSPLRQPYDTKSPSSPEQFKAGDIALSLSVIEGDYYSKITQADYIAHLRGKPITKNIESAAKVNNRLVNWVKTKVLRSGNDFFFVCFGQNVLEMPGSSSEDVNKRATNFKRFVLTAEECRKLQNFSSMSAIVAALQSIPQLVLTRESKLTKGEKQFLSRLDEILAPQGDHRAYREALKNLKGPSAIPWLAVHLRSLQNFYDRNSATVVVDQRALINFSRCTRLLARIDELRRYRAPADLQKQQKQQKQQQQDTATNPGGGGPKDKHHPRDRSGSSPSPSPSLASSSSSPALAWVMRELDNAPSVISHEQFDARVSALAGLERNMRERRELELRSLGFETVPRRRPSSGPASAMSAARMTSLDSRLERL
ncbi:hypothetical protein BC827DRAFT_1168576 [Russula dissimulans]|nr:hypothetical protein BC827DRAFT_1168576 [Russula dissimulans]